jgi:hypothetical protein
MALPVVVPVGKKTADELRERMVAEIPTLRVGVSTDAGAHYGPVVTAAHKARVEGWIEKGVQEGAELVVDGRGFSLQGTRRAISSARRCSTTSSRDGDPTRKRSSARCCRSCAPPASRRR